MATVFLLDDHEIVRRGVREVIEADPDLEVIGEAGSVAEALDVVAALVEAGTPPDVAVLDVQLGDGTGIEVCRELRSRYSGISCLMLTSFADDEALVDSVVAGALGYVLKQVRGSDLVDQIRAAASGRSLLDPAVVASVRTRLRERAVDDERYESMTDRERSILELLAEGLTNREIGERLYLSEKTVKNNMSNVLMKLGMQRRTEAALYAAKYRERESGREHGS